MRLRQISGRAYRMPIDNLDTDQIIAARHLKTLTRSGLGAHAFEALRNVLDNPIDNPMVNGAPILITGKNFGCGSSREHAVWALMDLGLKAVLAPSFSDIFAGNALKCGLAAIELEPAAIERLLSLVLAQEMMVELEAMEVSAGALKFGFAMDEFRRDCLVKGLDEIGLTLSFENRISAHEHQMEPFGWVAGEAHT